MSKLLLFAYQICWHAWKVKNSWKKNSQVYLKRGEETILETLEKKNALQVIELPIMSIIAIYKLS